MQQHQKRHQHHHHHCHHSLHFFSAQFRVHHNIQREEKNAGREEWNRDTEIRYSLSSYSHRVPFLISSPLFCCVKAVKKLENAQAQEPNSMGRSSEESNGKELFQVKKDIIFSL